jgi:hypothetical protein
MAGVRDIEAGPPVALDPVARRIVGIDDEAVLGRLA